MGRTSAGAYRRIARRLACVTQVLTVQVYSLSLRWWQLSRRWPVKLKPSPARRRRYERPFSAFSAERRPRLPAQGRWGRPLYALQVSALIGDIPSVLAGETLHATTIAWPDQVDSEAALAALAVSVAGTSIGADFVMAQASAVLGAAGAGTSNISNLSINGVLIPVSGGANQAIYIPGGLVVINEQQTSLTSTVVNALHVIV